MKKAVLFEKKVNQSVRCTACSWYCNISSGRVGVCATRFNRSGTLYSLVYGKAIGLHSDPVEKKPLFHFLPQSRLLSFGTVGCNFACDFCQNWEMSQINKYQISNIKYQKSKDKNPIDINTAVDRQKLEARLTKLIDTVSTTISPGEIVDTALSSGVEGIAYTYNEPAIFAEYTCDTAKLARAKNLKNVYVSNGFESEETFEYIKPYIDAINIDLKSYRNEFYQKICKAKIGPVKENIRRFYEAGIETEVTTLVIPAHNDSEAEFKDITDFVVSVSPDIPWHISAFHPDYKMIDSPQTPMATLKKAYDIGRKAGLKYIYVGNVIDFERSSTHCPACDTLLVSRLGYDIEIRDINPEKGTCNKCGEKIYGVWS